VGTKTDDSSVAQDLDAALGADWREAQTRFLAEMVKVPSDNPPGDCVAHSARAAQLLEAMGFIVERHPVPEDVVRAAGMVAATNLMIRERFGSGRGPTIALIAHGDVVPPGLGWSSDPYGAEIREGWMYGRGAAVSKSDFATYAYALLALKARSAGLDGTVELHLTYDEETGGAIGPEWLLKQGISKPDFAISAGFSYAITTAHNGCLHLEVECVGKSAHAARPETGYDALHAATDVMAALYDLRKGYAKVRSSIPGIEHPTLVIGLIEGGINTNVVPDNVKFRIDRRIIPDENPEAVEHDLVEFIREAAETHPTVRVRTRRIILAKPFVPLPGQEKLVAAIQRHAQAVLGEAIAPVGSPLYTDARHYSAAGIPTVLYGAGPRSMLEANAHRADERILLADVQRATAIVAGALADLLKAP
jgi:acetylornithine deacetylase/succinyl-diaminopimelate desuccinylase-like protein